MRNVVPRGASDDGLSQPGRGKDWDTSGRTLHEWVDDSAKDHNAGCMVRGVGIIRVNPLPANCEEFDIINGGWAIADGERILTRRSPGATPLAVG